MANSNAISWKRISIEAGAIVISILFAFSIDAWWEARQDQVEEREILIGLEAEFIDLRSRLDTWAGSNNEGIELIDLEDDAEFRALLTVRHVTMGFAAADHENARTEADEILSLIRLRLKGLGREAGGQN